MSYIKNLNIQYDDFSLNIETLEVSDQGITLLQGPSGIGKTTFLRCLMGLEKNNFEWEFQGENLAALPPPQRRLGVVFQSVELFSNLTVIENILFHARARNLSPEAYRKKLQRWLEVSGLEKKINQKVQTLSGGEKQRVALLRALIGQPKILLLDEPFSALDQRLKKELRDLIKEIVREEKIPCLVVSHDENDATNFADHVIIFENGHARRKQ